MPMVILQLDENCDFHTLCYSSGGEIKPLTDFEDQDQAETLLKKIKATGYSITLTEPSTKREFSIGKVVNQRFIVEHRAEDLESALQYIGVSVDFVVEPPLIELI